MEKYIWNCGLEASYISSRQNPRVVSASKLADKKYREQTGTFLCDGVKLTLEASRFGVVREVYIRESSAENVLDAALDAKDAGGELFVLSDAAFDKITTEKSPQGIVAVAECRSFSESHEAFAEGKFIMMLDSVRDPGNLGTILRSACALGASVALYSCADLYNPKTVRAAMGALFKADVTVIGDGEAFVRSLVKRGRRVLAACPAGDSLILGRDKAMPDDCVVIGNEGHGISDDILRACTSSILIPMEENTESLNASAAASVILWEYARG